MIGAPILTSMRNWHTCFTMVILHRMHLVYWYDIIIRSGLIKYINLAIAFLWGKLFLFKVNFIGFFLSLSYIEFPSTIQLSDHWCFYLLSTVDQWWIRVIEILSWRYFTANLTSCDSFVLTTLRSFRTHVCLPLLLWRYARHRLFVILRLILKNISRSSLLVD